MLIETIDNATFVRSAAFTDKGAVTLGGLMIFRKKNLDAVGGVEMLGDALADDLRAGELLHKAGDKIRLADATLVHDSGIESAWSCLARHHRWATSIRTEVPLFFWMQLLFLNPLTATLTVSIILSVTGSEWAGLAWMIFGISALIRTVTAFVIDRKLLNPHGVRLGVWCLGRIVADAVSVFVMLLTLLVPYVFWRGRWFRVRWGSGRILREVGKTKQ